MKFYDNTKVSTHRECPRKYFYAHVLHISPEKTSSDLVFGISWHAAMDVVWDGLQKGEDHKLLIRRGLAAFLAVWTEHGFPGLAEWTEDHWDEFAPRTPHTALGMLTNYLDKMSSFIQHKCEVLAVEQPFAVPLFVGDTKTWYCGRQDKVVRYEGKVWVVDHKTTTQYKKDGYFKGSFIDGFAPNHQMEGYAYGATVQHRGDFGGILIDAALVHKTVFDGFRMLPIIGSEESLDQWLWETQYEVKRIEEFEEATAAAKSRTDLSYLPAFPRNTRSCFNFGKACPYLDLCKGWENPLAEFDEQGIPMGFIERVWNPFEVNELEKLGMKQE